jgi:hypothetical protein
LPDSLDAYSGALRLKKAGIVGTDPFTDHMKMIVGAAEVIGSSSALEPADFDYALALEGALWISPETVNGWYLGALQPVTADLVEPEGITQMRLFFSLDDNNDSIADYLKLFSGNADTAKRPQLIIYYYLPST